VVGILNGGNIIKNASLLIASITSAYNSNPVITVPTFMDPNGPKQ